MRAHATYSPSFFFVPGIGGEGVNAISFSSTTDFLRQTQFYQSLEVFIKVTNNLVIETGKDNVRL